MLSENIQVGEMVREWLQSHGYDGLWTDFGYGEEACGCGLDDLFPCGGAMLHKCVAAKRGSDELYYGARGGSLKAYEEGVPKDSGGGST